MVWDRIPVYTQVRSTVIVVFYKAHAILYSCILYCVLLQGHFYIVLAEVKKANQIQLTACDTWSLHASLISATRYPTYLIDSCTPDFSSTDILLHHHIYHYDFLKMGCGKNKNNFACFRIRSEEMVL